MYYLQSRYYDPVTCRFLSGDDQISGIGGDVLEYNIFAYCGNNPINRSDLDGHAWWHWALAATVVVACAVAVVVTAGGAAAGIAAVASVAGGMAASTTASTVAAAAFIGSATVLTCAALDAASNSNSLKDFADQGNWGTVVATAGGAVVGGCIGYVGYNDNNSGTQTLSSSGKGFASFRQLKKEIGPPEPGNEWHHIVEQCQISKSGFNPQIIHSTNNIASISNTMHRAISGYYSSIQPFTDGLRVRDWLAGQSFKAQYDFGMNVISIFK